MANAQPHTHDLKKGEEKIVRRAAVSRVEMKTESVKILPFRTNTLRVGTYENEPDDMLSTHGIPMCCSSSYQTQEGKSEMAHE